MIQLPSNAYLGNSTVGYGDIGFDSMLYGNSANRSVKDYIENNLQSFSSQLTNAAKSFAIEARNLYESINSDSVKNAAAAILRKAGGIFITDTIYPLLDLKSIMSAQPSMINYVMAHIPTRALYQDKLINGYSDSYVDKDKSAIGDNHYHYRNATTGVVQINDEDISYIKFHTHDLEHEDDELTHHQKVSIQNTWELLDFYLENSDFDYTNIFGGNRG